MEETKRIVIDLDLETYKEIIQSKNHDFNRNGFYRYLLKAGFESYKKKLEKGSEK